MYKNFILIVSFFLVANFSAQASAETSATYKNQVYKGCFGACKANQRKLPENAGLLDTPFVLESFCSCYCTRVAFRMPQDEMEQLGQAKLSGKDTSKESFSEDMQQVIERSTEACQAALFED